MSASPPGPAEPVRHIYWVRPRLLAGRPGPEKFPWHPRELIDEGIGGVISLSAPVDTRPLRRHGIAHLPVPQPMILLEDEPQREQFLAIMPLVLDFIQACAGRKKAVLVHCYHGCDRTGAVLACALLAREGLSSEQAIAQVRAANPLAMEALGYSEVVSTYERLRRGGPSMRSSR